MNIKQVAFPANQYIQEEPPKKQIYLHHTAGNASGEQVFKAWESNAERIATCVAISGKGANCVDGQIIQGFSSKHWAYHLGLQESTFQKHGVPYKSLDKLSIGIEICNWGLDHICNRSFCAALIGRNPQLMANKEHGCLQDAYCPGGYSNKGGQP